MIPQAFHVNSTAPFFAKNGNREYSIEKFDLYCSALSALLWRKNGGRICMATDRTGAGFYRENGLCGIWDEVSEILPSDMEGINPLMFWAGGKLLALREIASPVVIMDTDFIVWEMPMFEDAVLAAHRENLMPDVYPSAEHFSFASQNLLNGLDWDVLPLNTAFLYLPDEDFKQLYVNCAIAFMKSAYNCNDFLTYMVFTEQRLLAMLAKKCNIPVKTLMDKDKLFFPQEKYTHLWGAKQAMRDKPDELERFCERCRNRIYNDFPQYSDIADAIEKISY